MDELDTFFSQTAPDDLALVFREAGPGKLPLEQAHITAKGGFEALGASMVELGSGLLLTVQSVRCSDAASVFRPLDQRAAELEGYRKRNCIFRRNGDPHSNFFTVDATGDGTIWICNKGKRSLRFQMPDGRVHRVCAGYTEALAPSNVQTLAAPIQVLLDLGSNPLDCRIGEVHVRYGASPWQRGEVDYLSGTYVDSFCCRVSCGDDCLGVLESFSDFFLERPRLGILDIDSYGPSQWSVRNKGKEPLPLVWPDGRTADVPADGAVYRLEALAASKKEGTA